MSTDLGYIRMRQLLLLCEIVCCGILVPLSLTGFAAKSTQSLKIWVSILLTGLTGGRLLELTIVSHRLFKRGAALLRDQTWWTIAVACLVLLLHGVNVGALLVAPDEKELDVGRPTLSVWLWRWIGFFVPLNFIVAVAYPAVTAEEQPKAREPEPHSLRELEAVTNEVRDEPPELGVTCSICLVDMESGERVRLLHCGHFFHEECIVDWAGHPRRHGPICTWRCTHQRDVSI